MKKEIGTIRMKKVIEDIIDYILNNVEKYGMDDIAMEFFNTLLSEYETL